MTRQEIEQAYTIDKRGTIVSPGKFEGEPIYAPYFFYGSLDGYSEEFYYGEGASSEYLIEVTDEDRAMFPELDATTAFVAIGNSDSGHVYTEELTSAEADKARANYERWCEENEESDAA
jgi:hypothetical protein